MFVFYHIFPKIQRGEDYAAVPFMSPQVVEMLRRLAVEAPVSTSSTVRVSYLDGEKDMLGGDFFF